MLDSLDLLATIKAQQTKPKSEAKPKKTNKQTRMMRVFAAIDRKHAVPKIRYFPQERRYAFPANIGNAVNPLVFGRIPIEYQIAEKMQNAIANHNAGLCNTNKTKYLARIKRMNYKHY